MNRQQEQSLPPSNTEESQFSAQLPTRWGRKSRLFIIYSIASLGQYYHLVIIATLRQYCHLVYMGSDSSPGPPRPGGTLCLRTLSQITSLDWANELPMYAFSLALQWLPSLAQSTFVPWANDLPMRCQLIASSSPMISHCRFNGNSLGISWQLNGNSLVSQSW